MCLARHKRLPWMVALRSINGLERRKKRPVPDS